MSDAEFDAMLQEHDRIMEDLVRRIGQNTNTDAPLAVDILRCPACGVFGEHRLDRFGFPAECLNCGWERGAV